MIRKLLTLPFRPFIRRHEEGQSIVLLAIGFIALVGFVGIVTDVSLLFVRYGTLRRAVDAASIAAATQMRQDRDYATVSLAARQFIEFHGLNPVSVTVETCANSPYPDTNGDGFPEDPELKCQEEQRKLVRVIAQVESPTVFLRLLGWDNIILEVSAISETAVIDVVIVMDVSESMLSETTYEDWARIGYGKVYVPPHWLDIWSAKGGAYDTFWQQDLLGVPQITVNNRLDYGDPSLNDASADPDYGVTVLDPFAATYGTQNNPRPECRVRFWPFSLAFRPTSDLLSLYGGNWTQSAWGGFVPTYNFYGCCNDPGNGQVDLDGNVTGVTAPGADGDFSDLICQPFKQAKDATRLFLERIDFTRGDRVAFVTFDRSAYIINPWNADARNAGRSHMIETFDEAVTTLNRYLGVRAEPNFYAWDGVNPTGGPAFANGWTQFANGVDSSGNPVIVDYNSTAASNVDLNLYPVSGNCPYQNAALPYPFSRYATRNPGGPDDGFPALLNIMTPNINMAGWNTSPYNRPYDGSPPGLAPGNSYELWANCRGTNIGAALREGNNALLDPRTSRREGTVWIMVLLSDGAAGASDPVRRNGNKISFLDPYQPYPAPPATPNRFGANSLWSGTSNTYGSFGVCPYGNPSRQIGELADTFDPNREDPIVFPFCSDESPESRHFCDFEPGRQDNDYDTSLDNDPNLTNFEENALAGNVYDVDIGNFPTDCELYDVDDYARDWADFVGLDETGDQQLPTIFTIGFGLTFSRGSGTCEENIEDCLGEELLRYIADVGDNFRIDTDYQQDWREDGKIDGELFSESFGPPGPCEDPNIVSNRLSDTQYPNVSSMISRLPPRENCGNYFNSPSQAELQSVYDEIASRMCTRLAG